MNIFDIIIRPNEYKFDKASRLFSENRIDEAIILLTELFDKHPCAPYKLGEIKFSIASNVYKSDKNRALIIYTEILDLRSKIKDKIFLLGYEIPEAKVFLKLAEIKFDEAVVLKNNKDYQIALNYLDSIIKQLDSRISKYEFIFSEIRDKINYETGDIKYLLGIKEEKLNNLNIAFLLYESSINYLKKYNVNGNANNAYIRFEIVKFKKGDSPNIKYIESVKTSDHPFKNDLFFRYSLWLFKNNEYNTAEDILNNYIDSDILDVFKLKEIIRLERVKTYSQILNDIYSSLNYLYENNYPIDETINLYSSLDNKLTPLSNLFPEHSKDLYNIKPSLFNRILTQYFNNVQFESAFGLITNYPKFYELPELMKDLGISAFRIAYNEELNSTNFKDVISCWLTCVFSDKVILKSLENTSWDDEYTFTLAESFGNYIDLSDYNLENINYEDSSDSNISIGKTQKELVKMFEDLLHSKILDRDLLNQVQEFYSSEKSAIEKIIDKIPDDIYFATPYFAKKYGLHVQIVSSLENDYLKYNDEESLNIATSYLKENNFHFVNRYYKAKKIATNLIEILKSQNLMLFKTTVNAYDPNLFSEFNTVRDILSNEMYTVLSALEEYKENNENLISLMEDILRILPNDEKIRYQYSNFVSNLCVIKVNSNEYDNYTALKIMFDSIKIVNDNPKACKNLSLLLERNIRDILYDGSVNDLNIYDILSKLYSLKRKSSILNNSLKYLNSIGYELQRNLPLNVKVSLDSGFRLNDHGMRLKKVLEWLSKF